MTHPDFQKYKVFCIVTILVCLQSVAICQKIDSSNNCKWINYNRVNEKPFYIADKKWENRFITSSKDTLERTFSYSHFRDTGPILFEFSKINGKINGLTIGYHPNGKIYSVQYFLDGLLWAAISLSDSSGKSYFPGSLTNGNGTMTFLSNDGQDLGFQTYKNGHPDGLFFHKDVYGSTAVKGELRHRPECVNYNPAIKVTYVYNRDTVQDVIELKEYKLLVQNDLFDTRKLIKSSPDSMKELPSLNQVVGILFDETEVVPVGKWTYFDYKTNVVYVEYEFDDCGNEIKRTYYDSKGKITDTKIQQPAKKRKRRLYSE
jgi:antitoxin component YwqK of YwqJK toxin-antitoxin module